MFVSAERGAGSTLDVHFAERSRREAATEDARLVAIAPRLAVAKK
jgi:hypothetical protein